MKFLSKNNLIAILLTVYSIVVVVIIIVFDGTGEKGSGDSILHYLFSKYAPSNTLLYFDHWAKPFFVLVSSPFAQFGIIGIKIFNATCAFFSILFTYKTAKALKLSNSIVAPTILLFTPLYFILIFSGLTEILFSLILIISSFYFVKKKFILASTILSFLPFVRSEGLIIIGIFAFHLLIKKQWKVIPFLALGHVFYSVAGYFYYDDILWVFTKIPYAKLSSTYNSGELFHFAYQLFYIIGLPIYVLFIFGLISVAYGWIKSKKTIWNETSILILGGFLSYFIAHSLFWYLGIFNSMGLKRVLIAVAPLIAIISLIGYNFISGCITNWNPYIKNFIKISLASSILIFPFTPNKSAINWETDFELSPKQKLAKEVVEYIGTLQQLNKTYIYTDPLYSELLQVNHFDEKVRLEVSTINLSQIKNTDIVIWDSWFCIVENGISEQTIRDSDLLSELRTFKIVVEGKEFSYILFKKK